MNKLGKEFYFSIIVLIIIIVLFIFNLLYINWK
ncbi:hypothetical protein ERICI_04464 [Paenibacillus larvae subsp. larvae]|uniref:Uncharacterized protein n=1 Tax=Paenibacillus larvae subsp. larvae TaxID=147375 RepID=A0A6C0QYS0_9BACL|nr:hypothetical protein ERICI_04464 [Paenibacillus larvae subsp. larvae]ETK28975.1 hypothetical protein ERIC1_1c24720 [Paenibacillus larvae subsp. larvae DSM 25719]QHZ53853.1 hypothetical protein ERICV_04865 [Paenibacillus larvae subsp. larvae]